MSVTLHFLGLTEAMQYDRVAILDGEYWRLLTGNFVHLGLNHLLLNTAGLALVAALVWQYYTSAQWAMILAISCAAVGVGVFIAVPELRWYVGLSGVLHGLLLAGACVEIRRYPQTGWPLMLLVIGKLVYEQFQGSMPFSEAAAGGPVVVESHAFGGAAGLLVGLFFLWKSKAQKSSEE